MMTTTAIHPDAVLESLLAKGGRSQRQRNLKAVHGICHRQHQVGVRDFSTAGIGKLCEAAGVLKGRALYNAQSADYRTLIEAWAAYAGPAMPQATQAPASHAYLLRIEDPAIRSLMQAIIVERDKLKAQINTLKANTKVIIDRRPLGAQVVAAQGCATPLTVTAASQLTDSERQALRRAVAPEFLRDQGWRELEHGEIVNDKGRTVFDPGYATAIRKVLGS
ncbi:gamma-mobile-trio protein GmtX [Cupriavidus consociatus]|uniref:gamma-mobile-trio protein GmtX n=1 Tax=Cupriavidus consociatus TaxID=2821357 RepID=UPI001AE65020|nr:MULTISPECIES: gamma-mobile-trio protein GmtX [unclassified Cupriavidus]MBP0623403.1 alpha/beta hydrolase [Cupriavidus sp. LEh25]MDK2660101.1 gamma-mobile-trio protein GmtX [Cupriavidus sp. LEh21]